MSRKDRQPRVLVLEDEQALPEILELNFCGAGYRVTTAADGVTGWQRLPTGWIRYWSIC